MNSLGGVRAGWVTSNLMLMFLENMILKHTKTPIFNPEDMKGEPVELVPEKEVYKPVLIQWVSIKAMIFELYDHRLKHAEEVDGATNTALMSMDEHLACYMLLKHQTRIEAERACVDFLSSLKYYADAWPRARTYA